MVQRKGEDVRLLVLLVVHLSETLLVTESVSRPNRRNNLLSKCRAFACSFQLLLLVTGYERIHHTTSQTDAGDDGRDDEGEAPVSNDGDDKTGNKSRQELHRDSDLVADALLDQVRVGLDTGRDL